MKTKNILSLLLTLLSVTLLLSSFIEIKKNLIKPRTALKSDTIDVLNYAIHLNIIHLSTKTISGYTQLTIVPKINSVSTIPLDLLKMTVDSVIVNNSLIPTFFYNDTLLRIPLILPLNINDTISVKVYYHGQPVMDPSGWGGFYFSGDSVYAYNLGVGFQDVPHNYGRVWFPCLDDFVDRATYDCYIRVKDGKTAVCGGSMMNETNNGDGTKTFYWRIHNEIPTYLASVAVGDYVPVSSIFNGMNGNIPVKIYVPPYDTAHAKASFANLLSILGLYESYFGPYLWERVGYVGVPFNSGAMEHATNIAYPLACIDGGLTYEDLYAHELSHHWFGDLVTCETAGDMWINEGWADYCESQYREGLYGEDAYKANIKANHYNVLSKCHIDDGGYFAIYGIPLNITYGSTVYKKGADVIHTLRNYLGDSLFFSFTKAWLNTYKFKHISTAELEDFITSNTGVNVGDFFDGWVFSAGFPHYSIDSVVYTGTGNDYRVYARQKLHHKPAYVNSNKVEITFMNNSWQKYTVKMEFSGQTGSMLFSLPFTPVAAMMDLDEKTSDATTDYYKVIKTAGSYSFPNSFFTLNVTSISDSAFFRIEQNWVSPDPLKTPSQNIYRIADKRYWKVDGIFPANFTATGKFAYNRGAGQFESTLLPTPSSTDSLILLYRVNTADDWHSVNFIRSGNNSLGFLTTQNLQRGEYTFGIGEPHQSGILSMTTEKKPILKIYPNPTNDTFNIETTAGKNSEIKIYDSANNLVKIIKADLKQGKFVWKPNTKGTYFFYLYEKGKIVGVEKAICVQ